MKSVHAALENKNTYRNGAVNDVHRQFVRLHDSHVALCRKIKVKPFLTISNNYLNNLQKKTKN